eukprot:10062544-Ditylum_brightwellii.AAC.1
MPPFISRAFSNGWSSTIALCGTCTSAFVIVIIIMGMRCWLLLTNCNTPCRLFISRAFCNGRIALALSDTCA